jgi:hypothetical protein
VIHITGPTPCHTEKSHCRVAPSSVSDSPDLQSQRTCCMNITGPCQFKSLVRHVRGGDTCKVSFRVSCKVGYIEAAEGRVVSRSEVVSSIVTAVFEELVVERHVRSPNNATVPTSVQLDSKIPYQPKASIPLALYLHLGHTGSTFPLQNPPVSAPQDRQVSGSPQRQTFLGGALVRKRRHMVLVPK